MKQQSLLLQFVFAYVWFWTGIAMTLFDGIDPLWMPRFKSAMDVAVAIIIALVAGTNPKREQTRRAAAALA